MKKIVFVHLLNDYSGSPKVLSQVVEVVSQMGVESHIYTCKDKGGFLDNTAAKRFSFPYRRFENKILTLFSFFYSQFILFFKLLKYRKDHDTTIYINTMLPFGAAIAGKLMRKKVVFHVHETSLNPRILKKFLRLIIKNTASQVVFVSDYLRIVESFGDFIQSYVIYNGIEEPNFVPRIRDDDHSFTVLMICSLKEYKGVRQFVRLSRQVSSIKQEVKFVLILNADNQDIRSFFQDEVFPDNLTIHSKLSDVREYYRRADLLVNLSISDACVEAFGLTIVEAMSYGLPVIVPPVGGPAEIVENYLQGYLIDSREMDELVLKVCYLIDNPVEYNRMSRSALKRSRDFSLDIFHQKIQDLLV